MHEKKMIITVPYTISLLELLLLNLKDLSKKTIKNYVKHNMILINDSIETNCNRVLQKKDTVTIFFTKREVPKIDLKILYEDKDLIAIDKPCGLLTISNSKEKEFTAFHIVSDYLKESNKNAKLFVVHRLDQDTSGVLLFAKNKKIKEKLQKEWNNLVKKREYVCIVKGKTDLNGEIKNYLTMNHFQKGYSTQNKELGKLAITKYELIKYNHHFSMLNVEIFTGRRNQIRIHLSEEGHPILGDKKYGSKINPIGRLLLHAKELNILDPRNNKVLKIKSSVPKCFYDLIN